MYVISWREVKVIGIELEKNKMWIKEALEIRKKGGTTLNIDEGQYHLTHIFDDLLSGEKTSGN